MVVKPPKGWTEARTRSFIMSALRQASMKWPPRNEALRRARIARGIYVCEGCGEEVPATIPNPKGGRRIKNAQADHDIPIIDPEKGFENWDKVVERMFIPVEDYKVLCKVCHDSKTKKEREIAKLRNKKPLGKDV
jgi:ribosomal protein L37AE/L43A